MGVRLEAKMAERQNASELEAARLRDLVWYFQMQKTYPNMVYLKEKKNTYINDGDDYDKGKRPCVIKSLLNNAPN